MVEYGTDFDYDRFAELLAEHDTFEQERGWLSAKTESEDERLAEMRFMMECLDEEIDELYGEIEAAEEGAYSQQLDRRIGYELTDVTMFVKGMAQCLDRDFNDYFEEKHALNERRFPAGGQEQRRLDDYD